MSRKAEIFIKVIAWRVVSITLSFFVIYHFTGSIATTANALAIGTLVGVVSQWLFEMFWDAFVRNKLRHALSEKHGRTGWLVWLRRDSRVVSVDEHEPRSNNGEEWKDPGSPENAGREWT